MPIQDIKILLFLKAPEAGKVKTRLARSIGPEAAKKIYESLVIDQLKRLGDDYEIVVHFAPSHSKASMRSWLGEKIRLIAQPDGDLGERLNHAVSLAFDEDAKKVLCIGGDCPSLNKSHVEKAIQLLEADPDLVLGPSEDGGYYLLGLSKAEPELFEDIPWSTSETLIATLEKAQKCGLRYQQLEALYDIDEIEELQRAIDEGLLPRDLIDQP